VSRQKPDGVKEEDYIPELPQSDSEPGILPTEIRKLVDSRRSVKNLLKDPNLSEDLKMQYNIRQVSILIFPFSVSAQKSCKFSSQMGCIT
jgi:DNA polymerase alpha subunit A